MNLNNYLKDRKQKRLSELLVEHAGRCKAVGKSFAEVGKMIATGNKTELPAKVAIITTQERSADDVEANINTEVATSNIPTKLGEELLTFVRNLDRSAGAVKRAVINLALIYEYTLPEKYGKKIEEATIIIQEIFMEMEKALTDISELNVVKEVCTNVNALETKIDKIYIYLKQGYFEIEKTFQSPAALLILDHSFRDLEASADFAEDAADQLLTLVSRRG